MKMHLINSVQITVILFYVIINLRLSRFRFENVVSQIAQKLGTALTEITFLFRKVTENVDAKSVLCDSYMSN